MRTSFRLLLGLAAALPVLNSCQNLFPEGQGVIRISFQDSADHFTRASGDLPDTDDFLLSVAGSGGDIIYEGRFGASPEELTVSPGTYTVSATSEKFDAPAFDKAVFGDTQAVVVPSGETVSVRLVCRQTNCGLRLLVDDSFISLFPDSDLKERERHMEQASPICYASRTNPPTLLMHGDADRLVSYENSRRMYEALKAAGNDVRLITVPGQGHGFFDGEDYYGQIFQFLEDTLRKA